jgi:predicted  nucleic acid-binding Zn-ribbon protein
MGRVYELVRDVVQGTLTQTTPDATVSRQATGNEASLPDTIEELDKIFADGIHRLKAAVSDNQAVALSKTKQAEEIIDGLKANIIVLEARLRETEDTAHSQNIAGKKTEESLRSEISNLQRALKEKEEALQSRTSEVNDLRSKIDVMAEQISQSELAVRKAQKEAASQVQEAEQVIEGLKGNIIVLEATVKAQLSEPEQIVGSTDSSTKELDQKRDTAAIDLNGHLQPQRNGMEVLAEAFANLQTQAMAKVVGGEPGKTVEEKSSTLQSPAATPLLTDAARETVSPEVFVGVIAEFSKFANVIETIASLIVRDHVKTLGDSMEKFPPKRLPELLESLSNEISDHECETAFRERFTVLVTGVPNPFSLLTPHN